MRRTTTAGIWRFGIDSIEQEREQREKGEDGCEMEIQFNHVMTTNPSLERIGPNSEPLVCPSQPLQNTPIFQQIARPTKIPTISCIPIQWLFSMISEGMSIPVELRLDREAYSRSAQLINEVVVGLVISASSPASRTFLDKSSNAIYWRTKGKSPISRIPTTTSIRHGCLPFVSESVLKSRSLRKTRSPFRRLWSVTKRT